MNKARRADIERASALLSEALEILETASTDERDAFDNMPESLQGSERGQQADAAAGALESATESIGEAVEYCATATAEP